MTSLRYIRLNKLSNLYGVLLASTPRLYIISSNSLSDGAPAFVRILKLSFVRILSSDFVRMGFYRVLTLSEWVFIEF